MAIVNFKQGEDKVISVEVIKNNVAVDITTCVNIKAILKNGSTELSKYALVAETGYGTLEVPGTPNNQVDVIVEREQSKNFPTGKLTMILLCAFNDNTFEDNERVEEYKFTVGSILPGEGAQEQI